MGSGVILLKSNGAFSVTGAKLKRREFAKEVRSDFRRIRDASGGHKVIVAKTKGMRGL
jgi:hypothetical protein